MGNQIKQGRSLYRSSKLFVLSLALLPPLMLFQNCGSSQFKTIQAPASSSQLANEEANIEEPQMTMAALPEVIGSSEFQIDFKVENSAKVPLQEITCQLNLEPEQNCAQGKFKFSVSQEGPFFVQVSLKTKRGRQYEYKLFSRRDTLGPVVTVNQRPPQLTNLISSQFVFSATDENSRVAKIECGVDAEELKPCVSPYQSEDLLEGEHSWHLKVTDSVGNVTTREEKWTVDLGALTVSISDPPKPTSNINSQTFQFSSSGTTELVEYSCQWDTGVIERCESGVHRDGLSDGTHRFAVFARTSSGKKSAETKIEWTIDTVAPTVELIAMDEIESTNSSRIIQAKLSESVLPMTPEGFELQNAVVESIQGSGTTYLVTLNSKGAGKFSVKVKSGVLKDLALNTNSPSNELLMMKLSSESFVTTMMGSLSQLCAQAPAALGSLKQQNCSGLAGQKFRITPVGLGLYEISPEGFYESCFDWSEAAILKACGSTLKQKWKIKFNGQGLYQIASQDDSQCLNVHSNSINPGGTIGTFTCLPTAGNELFYLPGFTSGTALSVNSVESLIKTADSQNCMDTTGLTNIAFQKTCASTPGQKYLLAKENDGLFKIISQETENWCLDYSGRDSLFQPCRWAAKSQKWQLLPDLNSRYMITNEEKNICLTSEGDAGSGTGSASQERGPRIFTGPCNWNSEDPGSRLQKFLLPSMPVLGPAPKSLLVGAIRWDAWYPTSSVPSATSVAVEPTLYTEFDYRMPFYGWMGVGFEALSSGIPSSEDQKKMDREIEYANRGHLDYWAFVYYNSTSYIPHRGLSTALAAYKKSSLVKKPRYSLIIGSDYFVNPGWSPKLRVKELLEDFKSPDYLKISGQRPVIFIGNPAQLTDSNKFPGVDWNRTPAGMKQYLIDTVRGFGDTCAGRGAEYACSPTGLGEPFFVSILGGNADNTVAAGLDALSSYGTMVRGNHASWDDLTADDLNKNKPLSQLKMVPSITAVQDHRPRNSGSLWNSLSGKNSTTGLWYDLPTQSQWREKLSFYKQEILRGAYSVPDPGLLLIYAWNELDEGGGGLVPTKDTGTYFLDAIADLSEGKSSDHYDLVDNSNLTISYKGIWSYRGPDQSMTDVPTHKNMEQRGLFGNDESLSTDPGAVATLVWKNVIGFELIARKAPGRGIMNVSCDGGIPFSVDLSAPEGSPSATSSIVAECAFTRPGQHIIQIKNTGSRVIAIDAIRAKVSASNVLSMSQGQPEESGLLAPLLSVEAFDNHFLVKTLDRESALLRRVYVADSAMGPWSQLADFSKNDFSLSRNEVAGRWIAVTEVSGHRESQKSNPVPLDPVKNLALSAKIVASSENVGSSAAFVADNVLSSAEAWRPLSFSDWVQVSFSAPTTLNRVDLSEMSSEGVTQSFKILYCDQAPCDSTAVWKEAYRGRDIGQRKYITFSAIKAEAIRLQLISGVGTPAIVEMGIYLY